MVTSTLTLIPTMSTSKLTPNGGEKIIVTNTEQKIPEHKTQKQTEGENFEILEKKKSFFICEKILKVEFKSFL